MLYLKKSQLNCNLLMIILGLHIYFLLMKSNLIKLNPFLLLLPEILNKKLLLLLLAASSNLLSLRSLLVLLMKSPLMMMNTKLKILNYLFLIILYPKDYLISHSLLPMMHSLDQKYPKPINYHIKLLN